MRGMTRRQGAGSWRAHTSEHFWLEYPVVIFTDGGPSHRPKGYEVFLAGDLVATRPSLREAKQYIEDIYGPNQPWKIKRLTPEVVNHYY